MDYHDDTQPDDLEIASIGSLYVGHWDKKYWSCSRGKDRYPYPVGYRSIRTLADNICQMEVYEGLKGPLFAITTVDGSSFSGQTPDIAWENYQRSCSKVKSWGVKRFSNKIDGAELFGFKNPLVQRLLRELVNNVNKTQGGISVPPLFCNRSKSVDQTHPQVSDHDLSLVSALEEQDISRRRIKKRNASKDTIGDARPNKITNQTLQSDSKTDVLQQISDSYSLSPDNTLRLTRKRIDPSDDEDFANESIAVHQSTSPSGVVPPMTHVEPSIILHCQKEAEIISFSNCNRIEASGLVMHGAGEVNHHSNLASNRVSMGLDCSDSLADKHIVSQQKSNHVETETFMETTGLDKSNGAVKILFDRFSDAEVEQRNQTPSAPKGDYGEAMALGSSSDVYISDTYDSALGEVVISAFDSSNANPVCIKDDIITINHLSETSEHPLELVSKNGSMGLTTGSNPCASEPSHLTLHDSFCRDCIPEDAIFQGVAKDSLPEVVSSGSSGRGVEEVDLNLAGQELAKSMMAFLLPQAVPLLKKTYVRRRSRIRLVKANDPCCTVTSVNTPDPNAVIDHLNSIIHQGKLLSGALAQLPENTILKSTDASKSSSQPAGFTEYNQYLANEPFSGDRSSKDPMAVVPDNFENGLCSYDASMKEQPLTSFDERDLALQDNMKGNIDTSSLPITVVEEVNKLMKCFSQNDAYNQEAVTPDKKDGGLVNSIITDVQPDKHILPAEETNEESIKSIEKYSKNLTETSSSLDAAFFMQNSFQHFNHESEHNAEELSFLVSPGNCPSKDDNFEQNPPGPCHILNNLNDNNVSKEAFGRYDTFRPTKEKSGSFCPVEVVNFDMHKNNKVDQIGEDNHSLPCMSKYELVTRGIPFDTIEAQNSNSVLSVQCNTPFSETILCRNLNNSNASDMNFSRKPRFTAENYQSSCINHNADSRTPSVYEAKIDEPKNKLRNDPYVLRNDPYVSELDSNWIIPAAVAFQSQNLDRIDTRSIEVANEIDNGHKDLSHGVFYKGSLFDGSLPRKLYDGGGFMELVGCYSHPEPILYVTLSTNMNQLQLSVLCGFPEETNRLLFMYSISLQKLRGCPTFLGYTPLLLPAVRNRWNINIPFERSALQLTPDRQFLIFVSSIKAPRCRERKISCLCSNCKTESSVGMTIEIVRVNFGYVSRMTKLTTVSKISCISVCEPSYLIAVEEDGRLHAWLMNLTWRENLEEFMLPTLDCVSARILEVKGMPNCNSLIVGHNGLGDFGLWELSKRVLLAKFSSPKSTIYQIMPLYVFNWQMNSTFSTGPQSADHNMDIIHKTTYTIPLGSSFKDIAIWILISAADFASETKVKGLGTYHTGFWRLALMTKNTLIMGNSLDPRAVSVDASANNGIIGTSDGLFYKWEISSGRKLGNLTSINCGASCVALDGKTGATAVAGRDGRLQVFV